MILYCWCEYI